MKLHKLLVILSAFIGIGAPILTFIFGILKIFNVITWNWVFVFLPLIIVYLIAYILNKIADCLEILDKDHSRNRP